MRFVAIQEKAISSPPAAAAGVDLLSMLQSVSFPDVEFFG
jgi:hypothetical protein